MVAEGVPTADNMYPKKSNTVEERDWRKQSKK